MVEQQPFKPTTLANSTERISEIESGSYDGEHAAAAESLPDFSDRYETIELLGEGGMGTVFRAREKLTGGIFAIKLLKKELTTEKSALKRFEKEVEATSKLTHENLVSVYDHGYTRDGVPYLVMDCVNGKNLGEIIKESGPLKVEDVIEIAMQISGALKYAHSAGFIHRDLKPSNIILENLHSAIDENKSLRVKVADFGIAVVAREDSEKGETITQTGALIGSPQYMSPEQCTGQILDARSDIYSLGCVMYAMLAGKPPFEGSNPVQIILRQINEAPNKISLKCDDKRMADSLLAIILKCLAKDKNDRYKDTTAVIGDLNRVKNGDKVRFNPRARAKYKLETIVVLSCTASMILLIGIVTVSALRPSKQPPPIVDRMPSNLHERAFAHFREKSYVQALPLLEYLAATYKREGNSYGEAFCYQCMAQCHLALKQYDLSSPKYERALNMMNELVARDGPSPEATNMITETKTGYIEVLRALGEKTLASAMLRSLDVENLKKLESFYQNSNVPEDELRVRNLRHELEALHK